MAKLLLKLNQNGCDAIAIDEDRKTITELMATNIIFVAHVNGEPRTYNRDYVVQVLDDNVQIHNDPGQLL